MGNYIIKKNKRQFDKNVYSVKPSDHKPRVIRPFSAEEEASQIVREIREKVESGSCKYSDIAILHRTNANARAIFEELLVQDINFISYGNEEIFYENQYVKPLIEYLRLTYDHKNIKAIKEVLPSMYIAKDKVKFIESKQFTNPIDNPIEHILDSDIKPFQRSRIQDRIRTVKRIASLRPLVAIKALREEYERYLIGEEDEESTTLNKEIIKEVLSELEASCKKFDTNKDFVEHVDKMIKTAKIHKDLQKKEGYDAVRLMTIHRAKGLEWEHTYGISLVDGVLPHTSSLEVCTDVITGEDTTMLEEELRLLYVLITRAKSYLTLSIPQTIRGETALPSRFLEEFVDEKSASKDEFAYG